MNSTDNSKINTMNRRIAPRYKTEFPIGMELGESFFCESRSLNVSTTGVRVVVKQALGEGVPMSLILCLDEDNLVELKGRTVWQERLGSFDTHVVGVAFDSGQVGPRKKLLRWLRNQGIAA